LPGGRVTIWCRCRRHARFWNPKASADGLGRLAHRFCFHPARLGRRAGREDHDVTTTAPMGGLPAARRRRIIIIGLLRALAITAAVVAAYYLLPLDRLAGVPLGFSFVAGLVVLTAMSVYQVRAIINASYPAIRAIEALAATAPLFLVLFAAIYFLMAQADLNNFNVHSLTRTDALYFTVTVFTTVGFGDIVATTQVARLVVTVQMILDLVVLGLGVRVFLGAVQRGRQQHTAQETESS
jgi:voltage-gated potassium channel